MFCGNCGKQIPDASTFCLYCGARLSVVSPPPVAAPSRPQQTNTAARLLYVFAVVVLLAGVFISWAVREAGEQDTSTRSALFSTSTHSLIENSFRVGPRAYVSYPISLPARARITGRFQAQGGHNDIEVLLFDQVGFQEYESGGIGPRAYYASRGYVTSDTIDKTLPAGNYYFVFNNRAALLTSKTVWIKIDAEY